MTKKLDILGFKPIQYIAAPNFGRHQDSLVRVQPMENLFQNLQRTIKALEILSEKGLPQAEHVDELLDQLFQQKIDLANLTANPASPAYQQASQALSLAANRAEKAAKDPAQIRELMPIVTEAIGKLTKLLNSVVT